jgi:hypothetical protein
MSAVFPPDAVDLDAIVKNPKILVFSKPKAGKTTLAASDDDVLILNTEAHGTISANRSNTLGNNVKQVDCTKWESFDKHVVWLEDYADKHNNTIDLKWVVVDTITTLQDRVLMRWVLDQAHAKNSRRDLYVPDQPDYGRNQIMLVEYIKRLNDLPVNVLYLAHVMTKEDKEGNEFLYPQIQGGAKSGGYKVAQQILAMTTSYGYMYREPRLNKERKRLIDPETRRKLFDYVIQWEDEGKMQGGDRLNVLGAQTKNVTLKQIRQRIESTNEKMKGK